MDLELDSQRAQLASKTEMSLELSQFRFELRSALNEFRSEMNERFSALESRMDRQFRDIELHFATLRAEMFRSIIASSGATIGAFGVMLVLFYFFANHLGR